MVEFETGHKQLQIFDKNTKIEDVVKVMNTHHCKTKFTVAAVDVGIFILHKVECSMSSGRKINQDMEVVVS